MTTAIKSRDQRAPQYAGLRMNADEYLNLAPDGFRYELVSGVVVPAYPLVEILAGRPPQYHGLRMTADEYLALPDDGYRYELIDGVTLVSPSPTPQHQKVAGRILYQLIDYLETHPVGEVFPEVDVRFEENLVYKPEIVFLRAELVPANWQAIRTAPTMICEVVSAESRRRDSETKKADYERYGVQEYWLIDPERDALTFYRLEAGRYVEVPPQGARFASVAVPGFELDLAAVRKAFRPG
jgi:Uma2 family endonuclease